MRRSHCGWHRRRRREHEHEQQRRIVVIVVVVELGEHLVVELRRIVLVVVLELGGWNLPVKDCSSANPASNDCTAAERDAYAACWSRQCDSELKVMLGDDYANGKLGGACKSVFECYNGCECTDSQCQQKCTEGLANGACANALQDFGECSERKCPPPPCYSDG